MKINKKPIKISSLYLVLSAVAVIVFASIGVYFFWQHISNPKKPADTVTAPKVDLNPPTTDQTKSGVDIKTSADDKPAAFSAAITSTNVNGDLVQIRAIINGAVSSAGTCDLTLTNSSAVVTKTAPTYAMPASSTCQGFDINRSELSSGTWAISLRVTIGTEVSTVASEVVID